MINGRTKGASAERELSTLIHAELGIRLVRNLEQSRRGGHDLIPQPDATGPVVSWLARYAIECKRYSRATPALRKGWWAQTCDQAERCGLIPCLAYREDRAAWRLVLPLCCLRPELPAWSYQLEYTVELSVAGFCALAREEVGRSGEAAPQFFTHETAVSDCCGSF